MARPAEYGKMECHAQPLSSVRLERACTPQADGNSTGVGNPLGYCYKQQPAWSAYRGALPAW